jgi:hypothetical protein
MTYLFLLMFLLSLLQPTHSRRVVALCYTIPAFGIETFAQFPFEYHFLYSALSEGTGIALLLYAIKYQCEILSRRLQAMCLTLVVLQAMFYGCWTAHVDYIFGHAIEVVYFNVWVTFYALICLILYDGATGGRSFEFFRVYRTNIGRSQYVAR